MPAFEELKNKFTMSYGMAFAVLALIFGGFKYYHEYKVALLRLETLEMRGDKRHERHLETEKDHETRIRALELPHTDHEYKQTPTSTHECPRAPF